MDNIKFKVGDHVKVIDGNKDYIGLCGVVVGYHSGDDYKTPGIDFKEETKDKIENKGLWNIDGLIKTNTGQFVESCDLELINKETKKVIAEVEFKPGMKIEKYVTGLLKTENKNTTRYKWLKTFNNCILPQEVKSLIEECLIVVLRSDRFEEWGLNSHFEKGITNAILLYGDPGTGKSMVGESIAGILNKNILKIDSGVIQSNVPGETERNIKENFELAKKDNAVLFLDECDSLLYNRDCVGAIQSSEINTLLTEIENFNGVVVLTTNRLYKLDPALQRRIIAKVNIPLPSQKAREQIFKKLIPPKLPLNSDVDIKELSKYELSGGEIKNTILLASRKAIAKNEDNVKMAFFLDAVNGVIKSKNEYNYTKEEYQQIAK
jgi:SpoVK/Ycf46/Vps4 family AAA+-type ATPase